MDWCMVCGVGSRGWYTIEVQGGRDGMRLRWVSQRQERARQSRKSYDEQNINERRKGANYVYVG